MKELYSNSGLKYHFEILDTLEAGMVLKGWEVKSIKNRQANLAGAFVEQDVHGLVLKGMRVPAWKTAPKVPEGEEQRDRRLLVRKREADSFGGMARRPGYTLMPHLMYVDDKGRIKLEIALVKGKKKFQKKQLIKERDIARQIQRELKEYS